MSAHNFEQHLYATRVVQAFEQAERLGKWTADEPHFLTKLQIMFEAKLAAIVGGLDQRFDDTARHRQRTILRHEETRYPDRAVDTAPSVAIEIERHENVARKHRREHIAHSSRMTNCFDPPRHEMTKPLHSQAQLYRELLMRQRMRKVPALSRSQFDVFPETSFVAAVHSDYPTKNVHDLNFIPSAK